MLHHVCVLALMQHAFVLALMQHAFVLALMQHAFVLALMQHAFVLARIRLTRMAAERGPILSGACGQMGVFHKPWLST
jgi:hypothetical protein